MFYQRGHINDIFTRSISDPGLFSISFFSFWIIEKFWISWGNAIELAPDTKLCLFNTFGATGENLPMGLKLEILATFRPVFFFQNIFKWASASYIQKSLEVIEIWYKNPPFPSYIVLKMQETVKPKHLSDIHIIITRKTFAHYEQDTSSGHPDT